MDRALNVFVLDQDGFPVGNARVVFSFKEKVLGESTTRGEANKPVKITVPSNITTLKLEISLGTTKKTVLVDVSQENFEIRLPLRATNRPQDHGQPIQPLSPMIYLWVTAIGFIFTAALGYAYLYKASEIMAFGISNRLYYFLLISLAASAAAFFFGAMKTYAHFTGNVLGGVVELGGPIVLACLVVIGGFKLVPQEEGRTTTFSVTIRVVTESERPLQSGNLKILIGNTTQTLPVDGNGEANVKEIASRFRMQNVEAQYESDQYEGRQSVALDPQTPQRFVVRSKH